LLTLLAIIALTITRLRNLFAAVIMAGIFSLVTACLFVTMGAVDVAFTEAAVGAGIATLLFLCTLALTYSEESRAVKHSFLPFFVVLLTGAILIYGTIDIPEFGDGSAPVHQHLAKRFIEKSPEEIGIPNMVTSVLASYRSYDTLGEVTVIFTAGIGVLILLGRGRRGKSIKADSDTAA
jgi:multicomponent Na+:H+ antiporter subunit B